MPNLLTRLLLPYALFIACGLLTACAGETTSDTPEAADLLQGSLQGSRLDDRTAQRACDLSRELQLAALGRPTRHAQSPYDDDDEEEAPSVAAGRAAFSDRHPRGLAANGRACADCHMSSDHFQLSPSSAKVRLDALIACRSKNRSWDDPLFRPIDADDFRSHGVNAQDFTNLTVNGLIRITFPLPANIKLVDPATDASSTETEVDVWRAVPTVNNVAITGPDGLNPSPRGPNPSGGYQLDARRASLQDQALGALQGHAQAQHAPTQGLLDDLTAFEETLFSSGLVRGLSAAIDAGSLPLPSAEPPLNALEQHGQQVFVRACATCHGGASQTSPPLPIPRYGDISSNCARPVDWVAPARWSFQACPPSLARNVRTYEITLPSGEKVRQASSDPGRALLTGAAGGPPGSDDWNALDVPTVRGISQTAPYFHNNSAATLEEVVDHYTAFFNFVENTVPPGVVPDIVSTDRVHFDRKFSPAERPALLAYLRKL